jgi:glycine dehydrogenase subunit 2
MQNNQSTELLVEMSRPGRRAARMPASDVPKSKSAPPAEHLAKSPPPLPELGELDVVRHYVNLSARNMCIDTNFYPLGSCTMKYNPKRNERIAAMAGVGNLHPYQSDESHQGMLELLYDMQNYLAAIAGLDAVSLQPAAGAHGELAALMCAAAYFRDRKESRNKVLVPDSAHGTNPASAVIAGFECITVKSDRRGFVDLEDLKSKLDEHTAVFMITNPNTLGLFDPQIAEIAKAVHAVGGLMYLDGANMNAILGQTLPGDFGIDLMHYNPHKTFSGPHGGGGPGAGPIAVRKHLAEYLPSPMVVKRDGKFALDFDRPKSIGRVRSFFANTGVLVRAYCYIRSYGPDGLKAVSSFAVLNANYLLSLVKDFIDVPRGHRCMHEFVASAAKLRKEKNVTPIEIAKRLLDHGFHAPTVYFPLPAVVPEAVMIEPTETESKETLEQFAKALESIVAESGEFLREAPHTLPISRPNEQMAATQPVLRWKPNA